MSYTVLLLNMFVFERVWFNYLVDAMDTKSSRVRVFWRKREFFLKEQKKEIAVVNSSCDSVRRSNRVKGKEAEVLPWRHLSGQPTSRRPRKIPFT